MSEQPCEPDTIAEVVAHYREARAVYRTLAGQRDRLYSELHAADQTLLAAVRLYERCLQENATTPEHARQQIEALVADWNRVTK